MFVICVYMCAMYTFSPHHTLTYPLLTESMSPFNIFKVSGRGAGGQRPHIAACASYDGGGAPCSDARCVWLGLGAYLLGVFLNAYIFACKKVTLKKRFFRFVFSQATGIRPQAGLTAACTASHGRGVTRKRL